MKNQHSLWRILALILFFSGCSYIDQKLQKVPSGIQFHSETLKRLGSHLTYWFIIYWWHQEKAWNWQYRSRTLNPNR